MTSSNGEKNDIINKQIDNWLKWDKVHRFIAPVVLSKLLFKCIVFRMRKLRKKSKIWLRLTTRKNLTAGWLPELFSAPLVAHLYLSLEFILKL